jgi:hypothetical protein
MLQLLPVHPNIVKNDTQLAVLYHQEPHTINNEVQSGFRVTFVSLTDLSALEALRKFAPETVVGAHGSATAWIPAAEVARVIGL